MPSITVNLGEYKSKLWDYLQDLMDFTIQEHARVTSSPPNAKLLAKRIEAEMGGPSELSRAVASMDEDALQEAQSDFLTLSKLEVPGESRDDMWDRMARRRTIQRDIWDLQKYLSSLSDTEPRDIENEYQEWREKAVSKTEAQAKNVVQQLTAAAGRSPDYETWPVEVHPYFDKEREGLVPGTYEVKVGRGSFNSPSFTLFVSEDGKITEVEDVLEGGDTDFFRTPKGQSDYFNLVNELRNPGSSSKGKVITLYTARPIRDRDRYEGARDIPANIFLATPLDEAEGIAADLGSNEVRDVWKVRVDTRHLVKTLESGRVRHYQTTDRTPVQSMELIVPGRRTAFLRGSVIRLAHSNPELRRYLLPLLT
jgi:hypothetical protein